MNELKRGIDVGKNEGHGVGCQEDSANELVSANAGWSAAAVSGFTAHCFVLASNVTLRKKIEIMIVIMKKNRQSWISSFVYKAAKSLSMHVSMKSECSNFAGSSSTSLFRDCRSPTTWLVQYLLVFSGKCCLEIHMLSVLSILKVICWVAFSPTLCLLTDIFWMCTDLGARVAALNSPSPWKRQKCDPKSMFRLEIVNVSMNPAEAVDAGSVFKK